MKYMENTTNFQFNHTVVCLGKFDGIHAGHRLLLEHMVSYKTKGYTSIVFTFDLHPHNLFSETEIKLIDTEEEKQNKLEEIGIDILVAYPFTEQTAAMSAEEFINEILVKKLDAKVIIVGKDFHFGHKRKGDVELLRKWETFYGYQVIAFDKMKIEGDVVSSTRIRKEIIAGNMELVTKLLGEPLGISGEVIYGNQLGRKIGIPTINQIPNQERIFPPNGVYISKVNLDGKEYMGVTNIGCKPTVSQVEQKGVETHILDFHGDLYGKKVQVDLYKFVRQEEKFSSIEELRKAIQKNISDCRKYFESNKTLY